MIEINRTVVKFHGELPEIMSEMQVGLMGLYDVLKNYYSEEGVNIDLKAFLVYMAVVDKATQLIFQRDKKTDGEIKDAIEYKDALTLRSLKSKKS